VACARLSLAITTYERPEALAGVLATVLAQSQAPLEILVADDGSGPATRALVESLASQSRVPLRHLWQPHEGFRLTRLRNLAIAAARGDYVVFVDGDMLLHREFVADHLRLARRGRFTQGVRVLLDESATASALRAPLAKIPWTARGLGALRRCYALHAPVGSLWLRRIGNYVIAIKGCNQGFWRDDLISVNGFNEDIVGWGPEDKELCARLQHFGVQRQSLLLGGIAYHLHHPAAARERRAANETIFLETLAQRRQRCARGLDSHASP
jgi:glycosyltransferase involved in cell wall biosynthesis